MAWPTAREILNKPFQIFLTGFLVVLPLAVTVAVIGWLGKLIFDYLGPNSYFGQALVFMGLPFVVDPLIAYLIGILIAVAGIFILGILAQAGLQKSIQLLLLSVVRRIPLVGTLYDLMHRFVGMFEHKEETDLKTMSPVWCTFGGEGGAAVLALLPTPEPLLLHGHRYHVVLIPTSPVPVGGGLICVPVDWVKPASFGIEGLTSIYVSMGVSLPRYVEALKEGKLILPDSVKPPES